MATYSSRLRLIKQATNENPNTWGTELNAGLIDMVDAAVAGMASLDMSGGNVTLSTANGTADQARNAILNITATGGVDRTLTIPSLEKAYRIRNGGTSTVLVKTASGTGVSILQGQIADVFCDGTECYRGGVSGWGMLSTTTLSGQSLRTLQLTVTGQQFSDALIRVLGGSKSASESTYINYSHDGTTWGSNTPPISTASTNATYSGMFIPNFRNPILGIGIASGDHGANNNVEYATDMTYAYNSLRFSTGISHVRLTVGGAATWTAGTAEVWLR